MAQCCDLCACQTKPDDAYALRLTWLKRSGREPIDELVLCGACLDRKLGNWFYLLDDRQQELFRPQARRQRNTAIQSRSLNRV